MSTCNGLHDLTCPTNLQFGSSPANEIAALTLRAPTECDNFYRGNVCCSLHAPQSSPATADPAPHSYASAMGLHPRPPAVLRARARRLLRSCYPGFASRPAARGALSVLSMSFVLSIVATGWYLVVPLTLLPRLREHPLETAVVLAVFSWCMAACVLSYLLTVFAQPGSVPDSWRPVDWVPDPAYAQPPTQQHYHPVAGDANILITSSVAPMAFTAPANTTTNNTTNSSVAALSVPHAVPAPVGSTAPTTITVPVPGPDVGPPGVNASMLRPDGRLRFCNKCQVFKPDRAHHCSSCSACVLVMDHHCPFTGNACIGIGNRKFFVLFLYYATISCTFVSIIAPPAIIQSLNDLGDETSTEDVIKVIMTMFGYMLCLLHAIALSIFSGFHTFLVLRNRTTIEYQELLQAPHAEVLRKLDKGPARHWCAVFGPRRWLWFVPVTYGKDVDGVVWNQNKADDLV